MIQVFQLIFTPFSAWTRLAVAQRGLAFALGISVLPLLVVAIGLECWALTRFGEARGEFGHRVTVTAALALRYGLAQSVLILASIFFSGFALHATAGSFNLRSTYQAAAVTISYAVLPIVLFRAVDALPWLYTWIAWGLGAALTASTLYHGVALMLKPEQTKGFGLYLVTVVIVLLSSGLAHMVAVAVLHGKLLGNLW